MLSRVSLVRLWRTDACSPYNVQVSGLVASELDAGAYRHIGTPAAQQAAVSPPWRTAGAMENICFGRTGAGATTPGRQLRRGKRSERITAP